jgi:hypothetical protein
VLTGNSSVTERVDNGQPNANYNKFMLSVLAYICVICVVGVNLKHMDEEADI